jgi:1-acyl-sn-glycerol-3-phosphate acyltransferase
MLYRLSRALLFIFFRTFFSLTVEGRSVFPKTGPFLLASNHSSNFDPPLLAAASPRSLYFMAKQELFKNKLFGAYLRILHALPLDRVTGDSAALRQAIRLLKELPFVVFPQGTRGQDMEHFKAGVGFLWKKTGVPVIACRIYGTDQILPKGRRFPSPGRIRVVFKLVEGLDACMDSQTVTARIMGTITSL